MSAAAKSAAKPKPPPLESAVTVCSLGQRRFQPQPARFVIGAAADAEGELGEPAELIVVAVPEGRLEEALELVRKALEPGG